MIMDKPFSQACANNQEPIFNLLQELFSDRETILEVGSGTGQHSAYFAPRLPHLVWQPTDLEPNLVGIKQWGASVTCTNLKTPLVLDVRAQWPDTVFDGAYTANTCHIMSWEAVEAMFAGIGQRLPNEGVFCVYGPFLYQNNPTSNLAFDTMLRSQDSEMGVRRFDSIVELADSAKLKLVSDNPMPANNRLLHFVRLNSA